MREKNQTPTPRVFSPTLGVFPRPSAFFTRVAAFATFQLFYLSTVQPVYAATVRTATETFVTNRIAAALAEIPAPDFSTANETLVSTIEATAPAPGDYSTVSNRAMNALQQSGGTLTGFLTVKSGILINDIEGGYFSTEKIYHPGDGILTFPYQKTGNIAVESDISAAITPATNAAVSCAVELARQEIATAATAATNYTDAAIAAIDIPDPTETDPVWSSEKSGYATTDALNASDRLIFAIVQGTNVMDVVTNYDSEVHIPERYLIQIDTNGTRKTIWRESTMLTNEIQKAIAAYDDEIAAALELKADTAWSKYTSGLGLPAPENTTWISTPETHIAGGFEYEKVITTSGSVWVLCSNGMDLNLGSSTNSFLEISAVDGTPIFRIEKTDSYLVGVDPSGISPVGSTVVVSVPAVNATHPFARVATNLTNAVWYKEDGNGMPSGSPATVSWSGTSGAYVATIDFGASPQGFCYFEYMQEGETKIVNAGVTDLSGGLYFNGAKYMPQDNDGVLQFVRVRGE